MSWGRSFETLVLGCLGLCVVRHIGGRSHPPLCYSTRRLWVPSISSSFDVSGTLLCVVPLWWWLPSPRCHWRCAHRNPSTFVSFDTLALGYLRLRLVRHLGHPRGRVVVAFALLVSSSLLLPFVLSELGLVGVVIGLPRHRPGSCGRGWAFQIAAAFVSRALGCLVRHLGHPRGRVVVSFALLVSSSLLSPFVLSELGLVGVVIGLPRHRPGSCGRGWAFQIDVAFVSPALGCRIVVELSGSWLGSHVVVWLPFRPRGSPRRRCWV